MAQWHDETNPVQFLMTADKATDETDGVWPCGNVSLEQTDYPRNDASLLIFFVSDQQMLSLKQCLNAWEDGDSFHFKTLLGF